MEHILDIQTHLHPPSYFKSRRSQKSRLSQLIPETMMEGLKRRFVLPEWWLKGILFSLGQKCFWYDDFKHDLDGALVNDAIKCRLVVPLLSAWNEVLNAYSHCDKKNPAVIELPLAHFSRGTNAEIESIGREVFEYFSSPFSILGRMKEEPISSTANPEEQSLWKSSSQTFGFDSPKKRSKKNSPSVSQTPFFISNSGPLFSPIKEELKVTGAFFPFRRVLWGGDRIILEPGLNFFEILGLKENTKREVVTVSPSYLLDLGKRAQQKKVLDYLFFEYSKGLPLFQKKAGCLLPIRAKDLHSFHKDFMTTAPGLYDHGFFGWDISSSNDSIASLKQSLSTEAPVLCFWKPSFQTEEASRLEERIVRDKVNAKQERFQVKEDYHSSSLFPPKIEKTSPKLEKEKSHSLVLPKREGEEMQLTLFAEPLREMEPPIKEDVSDGEFLELVNRFYATLKPIQRRFFEKEREKMPPRKFRSYIMSILRKKTHS